MITQHLTPDFGCIKYYKGAKTYCVNQVETDYSWALIQGVLLSCNKHDIGTYLAESYNLIKGNLTITDFGKITRI